MCACSEKEKYSLLIFNIIFRNNERRQIVFRKSGRPAEQLTAWPMPPHQVGFPNGAKTTFGAVSGPTPKSALGLLVSFPLGGIDGQVWGRSPSLERMSGLSPSNANLTTEKEIRGGRVCVDQVEGERRGSARYPRHPSIQGGSPGQKQGPKGNQRTQNHKETQSLTRQTGEKGGPRGVGPRSTQEQRRRRRRRGRRRRRRRRRRRESNS